ELALHGLRRLGGVERPMRAQLAHELDALGADVDTDHLVAERARDLDGVVTQPAGRADHRDRPTGKHVVPEQLLDRAVGSKSAAGERRLAVAELVGQLHQPASPYTELFCEGAEHPLGFFAMTRLAPQAVLAGTAPVAAARSAEPEDHAVADLCETLGAGPE